MPNSEKHEPVDRRLFCSTSTLLMGGGLVASYGMFGIMAGRFLYPVEDTDKAWHFVTELDAMRSGESFEYQMPTGPTVVIARRGETGTVDDYIALSSVCPHLGCQVHWESQNNRFFCPCHNGVFDPSGKATFGPPATAGQSLEQYPLKVEGGLLFIEVPTRTVVDPWRHRLELADNDPEDVGGIA